MYTAENPRPFVAKPFDAFVIDKNDGGFSAGVKKLTLDALPEGEVTVRVWYSSVNFKDGLACLPENSVVRSYPMVPGIDIAGTVSDSTDPRFERQHEVIGIGRGLGTAHFGGYAKYARVPADWLVPLPSGMSMKQSMILGTAGFTAGLAVHRLEQNGLEPGDGPVLVTGATGGVGSTAVSMLAGRGYEVVASTGKKDEHEYLLSLGASRVISREELAVASEAPIGPEVWAGCVDPVGGEILAHVLRTTRYQGSVATCGFTAGREFTSTMLPFIIRGVNLLGIDSVMCPPDLRAEVWARLATDLRPSYLAQDGNARTIGLDEVPEVAAAILKGEVRGRTVVQP